MIGQPKRSPGAGSPDANRAPRRPPGSCARAPLATMQRLVDRASGSNAVTVLINTFAGGEAVPGHIHEDGEVLLVTAGECTVTVDGRPEAARTGDAVITKPGTRHAISRNSDEPCKVVAVFASPDAQIGATR